MSQRKKLELQDYLEGIENQDIGILSRAISLVESQKKEDIELSFDLLSKLSKYDGKAIRIGVTGVPGAGKSTFLNSLGKTFCDNGHKIAVLTIDPSSSLSGGSILGDKTRMQDLSFDNNAYIRPSPSLGYLGGVAARTRETILLCEAFGFDTVFVESVGVGQSEYEMAKMVDLCIMLTITGGGDDLQGIKRGLLEVADWILINKADGKNEMNAKKAKREIESALHILKQNDFYVDTVSSIKKSGLENIYDKLVKWHKENQDSPAFQNKRFQQKKQWFQHLIEQKVLFQFRSNTDLHQEIEKKEAEILSGKTHPITEIKSLKM